MKAVGLRLALTSIIFFSLSFLFMDRRWFPVRATASAVALDRAFYFVFILLGALFLAGHLVLLWVLGASRSGSLEDAGSRSWRGNWKLEILWTVFIAAVFFWFNISGARMWSEMVHPAAHGDAVKVEITGAQFQWYFRYPGADGKFGHIDMQKYARADEGNPLGLDPNDPFSKDDIVSSALVLPAGREVDLTLRAQDVIHSVFIPAMRFKQDAVPGMDIHARLAPSRTGEYELVCSQLCGLGHYRMRAMVRVMSNEEFERWLQTQGR